MRIGIDLSVVDNTREHTGVSNYARRLAAALQAVILSEAKDLDSSARKGGPQNDNIEIVELRSPKRKIPFWSRHVAFAREIQKAKLDVFHGLANVMPWFYSPPSIPPHWWGRKGGGEEGRGRTVLTIHDLAIYKHPEWFPRGQWFATRFLVPRSIKKADRIIVPSEVTARDVAELFRVPREKTVVVPLGVEERFFKSDLSRPSATLPTPGEGKIGYILFVGTLEPRKNIQGVLSAYRLLPGEIREKYELWIVGSPSLALPTGGREGDKEQSGVSYPLVGEVRRTGEVRPFSPSRREGGDEEGVRYLGYLPDEQLPALYQGASVFVYPSFYEGFGLPVLEAMAAGVPVVTSKGSAMEEFAGDVAEFADPHSPADIATAIERNLSPRAYAGALPSRLAEDGESRWASGESNKVASPHSRDGAYFSEKIRKGVERAREYSWERTARETLRVYEEQVNN